MEKVTVKSQSDIYNGMMFGYQFHNGVAHEVLLPDAEFMVKHFGVSIIKPEVKEEAKTKAPRKKAGEK